LEKEENNDNEQLELGLESYDLENEISEVQSKDDVEPTNEIIASDSTNEQEEAPRMRGGPAGAKNKVYLYVPRTIRAQGQIMSAMYTTIVALADEKDPQEPQTIHEALYSPNAAEWKLSIMREFNGLKEKETFELIPKAKVPKEAKILTLRMAFKIKRDKNGMNTKYKTRIVVRGYEQEYGRDFEQTYAGVIKSSTWKIALGIAALHDLEVDLSKWRTYGL
jgi:hypothetical protein